MLSRGQIASAKKAKEQKTRVFVKNNIFELMVQQEG